MIKQISKKDFSKVKALFKEVEFNLNCLGVINGNNDGRIWVDNQSEPKTGLLVDNEWSIYLAGSPNNEEFNRAAGHIIASEILSEARKINDEFVFYYARKEWKEKITEEIRIKDPLPLRRCHYLFEKLNIPDWKDKIPPGYSIIKVSADLLEQTYLKNHEKIIDHINTTWRSKEEFLKRGFGFCLIKGKEKIVSWGIADWVTEQKAEMGAETDPEYRRCGFATLVTSGAADYCQKNDIQLGWHCSEHNVGSAKTAEKVGFIKERDYEAAIGNFDEFQHLFENAWYRGLYLNHPHEGIVFFERAFAVRKPKVFHLIQYANALVLAGKKAKAIEILNKACDMGPENPARFKEVITRDEAFHPLAEVKGWQKIISKLDNLIHRNY